MVKNKKRIALVGGARPNFMKIAPLYWELKKRNAGFILVNTSQHFDKAMARQFFAEFRIAPDITLRPSRRSIVQQTVDIMRGLEKIFSRYEPNTVVVFGDVNSTLCAALVANKMRLTLAHVEAGLRSHNFKMPEETNRIITDHLSQYLFTTTPEAVVNITNEKLPGRVISVGNIMIDTLKAFLEHVPATKEKFYFCTLHRAENVDDKESFKSILRALQIISHDRTIYLPLHPRTKKMAAKFGLTGVLKKTFTLLPPLSFAQTLYYEKNAQLVLTDSGGIQEETSFLGTPCLTLRTETERPVTVKLGTNIVAGVTTDSILKAYKKQTFRRKKTAIPLWDGKASKRIADVLLR